MTDTNPSAARQNAAKVALVTGGGTGIGFAAARALSADGFTVVITGRRKAVLEQAAAELGAEADARAPLALTADVANEDDVTALFDEITRRFSRLDVLFNNAGLGLTSATIDNIAPADWRRIVDVNLTGSFLCARAAFALMRRQTPHGGRIINNGSVSAHVPRPGSAPYTATKHAITGLTRTIALDGRPFNIACSQIDVGNAATEITAQIAEGVPQADGRIAPETVIDARHVGAAVSYIAGLPLDANVPFMTLMATSMPYIGRG